MHVLKPASLVLFMIVALAACGGPATEQPAGTTDQPTDVATTTTAAEPAVEPLEMVEVTAEGVELEPPVQVEQIPDGAWYCPMETVHYARMEQGDGVCPICSMDLVQKVAAAAPVEEPVEGEAPATEKEPV